MARIKAVKRPSSTLVVIAGRLGARDMRRFEHACSPALAAPRAELIVDLRRVTEMDSVAAALLRRMADRGAVIHGPTVRSGSDRT